MLLQSSDATYTSINACNVTSNTADQDGGGLHLSGGATIIANSTFFNNTAGRRGGAVLYGEQCFAGKPAHTLQRLVVLVACTNDLDLRHHACTAFGACGVPASLDIYRDHAVRSGLSVMLPYEVTHLLHNLMHQHHVTMPCCWLIQGLGARDQTGMACQTHSEPLLACAHFWHQETTPSTTTPQSRLEEHSFCLI